MIFFNKEKMVTNKPNANRERGFTLVELLIGLLISLFILGGAVTFLVTSSRTLVNQSSEDIIQENARFAFEIISSNLRLAGLRQPQNENIITEIIFDDAICDINGNDTDCNTNSTGYNIGGLAIDSDSIAVDYVIDSGTTCVGNAITQDETKVVTVFFIADIDGDSIPSLYCRSFESQLNPLTSNYEVFTEPNNAQPLAIIDGIDSLQIQYGVDLNDDGDIDQYSGYDNLDNANRQNVIAVKIGLLVSSGQTIAGDQNVIDNEARTYQLFDSENTITDALLRQIYSTTIFLPNRS